LLGEYGQGKSTATLMLAFNLIQEARHGRGRIPILLELRGKSPRTLQPIELLGAWAANYAIEPRSLMKLIVGGKILLILEAFDEMAEAGSLEARVGHFKSLWKFAYPNSKILITGRPNFFLDERELKAALGIEKASAAGAYCEALYLRFFREEQIAQGLKAFDDETKSQILQLARTDRQFATVVGRPSLLYAVSLLWKSENLVEKKGINSAEILDLFIRNSYKRQSEKSRNDNQFMTLSPVEREYFHDGIAARMVASGINNQILLEQFRETVTKLYLAIPDALYRRQRLSDSSPTRPLSERMKDREKGNEEIATDVKAYGILVDDYSRASAIRFAHKSFFEFIFANFVSLTLSGTNQEEVGAITAATSVQTESIVGIPGSLIFLGELLSETEKGSKADKLAVNRLFDRIVFSSKYRWLGFFRKVVMLEVLPVSSFLTGLTRPSAIISYFSLPVLIASFALILHSVILNQSSSFLNQSSSFLNQSSSFLNQSSLFLNQSSLFLNQSSYVVGVVVGVAMITHFTLARLSVGAVRRRVDLWRLVLYHQHFDADELRRVLGKIISNRLLLSAESLPVNTRSA
jgi:hypothetical protein